VTSRFRGQGLGVWFGFEERRVVGVHISLRLVDFGMFERIVRFEVGQLVGVRPRG
jgi:hypothetical protein